MIKAEKIAKILKEYTEDISSVEVAPEGFVRSRLNNHVDPERPYFLIVDPIVEKLMLRVCVFPIMQLRARDSEIYRQLIKINSKLFCGCVGVEDNNSVVFNLNHLCCGNENGNSPELVGLLLDKGIDAVRLIEKVALIGAMADAGVPAQRANQIAKTLFGIDQKTETKSPDTL